MSRAVVRAMREVTERIMFPNSRWSCMIGDCGM
jgi:hypothetical protein